MISDSSGVDKVLIVEHAREEERSNDFIPSARIHLTQHARSSGFLRVLSGTEARLFLALITHISANGDLRASASQVGHTLGIPTPVAAISLRRFLSTRHNGEPIIQRLRWETGLTLYTISQHHINHEVREKAPFTQPIQYAAGREQIIQHNRATYATTRNEAERSVMLGLGLHPEELEDSMSALVWRDLRYLKLKRDDIESLIAAFGIAKIRQQIDWLADRQSKNRARTLVTALINNWGPPKRLKDVLMKGHVAPSSGLEETLPDDRNNGEEGEHD